MIRVEQIDLAAVAEPPSNPNSMPEGDYRRLVRNIKDEGFLQPILVRKLDPDGEMYELIDGVHRTRAARDVGIDEVPAVVLPQDCPDSRVRLLQISMNRLRGQLDLTAVSETLLDLTADGLDLSLSGYSEGEITAMLDSAIPVDPNDLAGDASFEPDGDEDKPEKVTPFELKIELDSADELREVKRLLKKAGGRGKSMGEGLRKVLGLT